MSRKAHGRTRNAAERDHLRGKLSQDGFFAVVDGVVDLETARDEYPEFHRGEIVALKYRPRYSAEPIESLFVVEGTVQYNLRSDVMVNMTDSEGRSCQIEHYLLNHLASAGPEIAEVLQGTIEELIRPTEFEVGLVARNNKHSMSIDLFGAVIEEVTPGTSRRLELSGQVLVFAAEITVRDTEMDRKQVNPFEIIPAEPIRFAVQVDPEPAPDDDIMCKMPPPPDEDLDERDVLLGFPGEEDEPEIGESLSRYISRMAREGVEAEEATGRWNYYVRGGTQEFGPGFAPPYKVGDEIRFLDQAGITRRVRRIRRRADHDPGRSEWFVQVSGVLSWFGVDMIESVPPPMTDEEIRRDDEDRNRVDLDPRGDI